MESSVSASLDTSLSLVLLTGAREPTRQVAKASPLAYDLQGATDTGTGEAVTNRCGTLPDRLAQRWTWGCDDSEHVGVTLQQHRNRHTRD